MNKIIITTSSVTYAMKAHKLLQKTGIASKPIKVDESISRNGCTHGIEISNNDFFDAINVLKNKGIDYSVYKSI